MTVVKLNDSGAKAYLNLIYDAAWKDTERGKYSVDYQKLKSLIYRPK